MCVRISVNLEDTIMRKTRGKRITYYNVVLCRRGRSTETGSRLVVARGWSGGGEMGNGSYGRGFPCGMIKNFYTGCNNNCTC